MVLTTHCVIWYNQYVRLQTQVLRGRGGAAAQRKT